MARQDTTPVRVYLQAICQLILVALVVCTLYYADITSLDEMQYVIKTREQLAAEKDTDKKALAVVVSKLASRVPGLRITPYSVGILKATCRGGWIDNTVDGEWSFYSSRPIPDETTEAIRQVVPDGVQVSAGSIHFPSSLAA